LLAAVLVGQFETAETLSWKIERRVDAPEPVLLSRLGAWFQDAGGIDEAYQPPAARPRDGTGQKLADQQVQPVAALAQPIQNGRIGHIGECHGGGPGGRRAQAPLAQAIGEDQAQQVHGTADFARAQEGSRRARGLVE
jgi:hypothetical protein